MHLRYLVLLVGLAAILPAQNPAVKVKNATKAWTLPRTADGQPDFQGVWANNNATPLQRPKELAGRTTLTDEEVTALRVKAKEFFETGGDAEFGDAVFEAVWSSVKSGTSGPHKRPEKGFDGATGDYNTAWIAERDWDNRTALITDPPDGLLPAMTPAGKERQLAAAVGPRKQYPEGPEDRSLSERCISYGSPRLLAGYDSYYQFVQSRNTVAIGLEQIHDVRIIPLDGSSHPPATVQRWMGDSRGHWEGDTLVVDTANYKPGAFMNATEKLHTIERFTRTGPDVLKYEITVDDPQTWTKPWTLMIPLRHTNELMYEYACHEGNVGLEGILKGARVQEATEGAKK